MNDLVFNTETKDWEVVSNKIFVREYTDNEPRLSVVYRVCCFKDQTAVKQYEADQLERIPLKHIWPVFKKDLVKEGNMTESQVFRSPYDWVPGFAQCCRTWAASQRLA